MADIDELRNRVRAAVRARGLVSAMNDTKWRELVGAVGTLPFPPPYQLKTVLEAAPVPARFDADVDYEGDWGEPLWPYFAVEWIRVRPRVLRFRGRLAPPVVHDISAEFDALLRGTGVPYRPIGDAIEIVGHGISATGLR